MNSREAIFLSYLAYHNKAELDILNNGGDLKEGTDPIWIDLWNKLKDNYNHFSVFDCVDYDIGDTQFIYSIDKLDRLLISFRGTKCLNDILTDIRITKDKCIDVCYSPFYLKHYHNRGLPYIHAGFYQMFSLMKYELYHIVKKYTSVQRENYKIVLTGHSLGGSLSIIATLCLFINFHKEIKDGSLTLENITFGSPKVGNSEFSTLYAELIEKNRHYFHNSDPIPCVPVFNFYSTGDCYQINKKTESRFYSITYHLLECYLKHLEELRE